MRPPALLMRTGVYETLMVLLFLAGVPTAGMWCFAPVQPLRVKTDLEPGIVYLAASDDGKTLAVMGGKGIVLLDVPSGRIRNRLETRSLSSIGWMSKDGRYLVTGPELELWDTVSSHAPLKLEGARFVAGVSPDESMLMTHKYAPKEGVPVDSDASWRTRTFGVQLWDVQSGKELPLPPWNAERVYALSTMHHRRPAPPLAVEEGEKTGTFTVWNVVSRQKLTTLEDIHFPMRVSVADHRLIARRGQEFVVWELPSGKEVASIPESTGWPNFFTPDARVIDIHHVSTQSQSLWDISGKPRLVDTKSFFFCSENGKIFTAHERIQSGSAPHETWKTHIWNAETMQKQAELPYNCYPAPDGNTVFCKDEQPPEERTRIQAIIDKFVTRPKDQKRHRIFMVEGLHEILVLPDCWQVVHLLNGQALAAAYEDGTIEIWDIPPRRHVLIDYGLPMLFVLLLFLAIGAWRWRKAGNQSSL